MILRRQKKLPIRACRVQHPATDLLAVRQLFGGMVEFTRSERKTHDSRSFLRGVTTWNVPLITFGGRFFTAVWRFNVWLGAESLTLGVEALG